MLSRFISASSVLALSASFVVPFASSADALSIRNCPFKPGQIATRIEVFKSGATKFICYYKKDVKSPAKPKTKSASIKPQGSRKDLPPTVDPRRASRTVSSPDECAKHDIVTANGDGTFTCIPDDPQAGVERNCPIVATVPGGVIRQCQDFFATKDDSLSVPEEIETPTVDHLPPPPPTEMKMAAICSPQTLEKCPVDPKVHRGSGRFEPEPNDPPSGTGGSGTR